MGFNIDLKLPDIGMSPALIDLARTVCAFSLVDASDATVRTRWSDLSDGQIQSLVDQFCSIENPHDLRQQILYMVSLLRKQASDSRAVATWALEANNYIGQLPALCQSLSSQVAEQVVAQSRPDLQNPN